MSRESIPVDLLNPGQVFACLGFMEASIVLCGKTRATFDWAGPGECRFHLETPGSDNGFERVLDFLARAEVRSVAPADQPSLCTDKWKVPTRSSESSVYPVRGPATPATLVTELEVDDHTIAIDHWGDTTRRDSVKFWAGSGGYPGAALVRDALDLVRDRLPEAGSDPFAVSAIQSSSFRFDWRRDYIPLDVGFSLNAHTHIQSVGFPIVEVMAAIGLTHARPAYDPPPRKLHYRYAVIGRSDEGTPLEASLLPPPLLRAALGGLSEAPFACRRFEFFMDWPGQENQARCITNVIEETVS